MSTIQEKLVHGIRILDHLRILEDNYGHLSARVSETNQMCVLGHLHDEMVPLSEVTPEHMLLVDLETGDWEGPLDPPGEVFIHSHLYNARPDVQAVAHAHPELPVSLSVAGQPVIPAHHHGGLFDPYVPIFEDHRQIDNAQIATQMVEAMGMRPAVVLRAHGAVTVGESIEEAVMVMVTLDLCARRQFNAAQVGIPQPIRVAEHERRLRRENMLNEWAFHLRNAQV